MSCEDCRNSTLSRARNKCRSPEAAIWVISTTERNFMPRAQWERGRGAWVEEGARGRACSAFKPRKDLDLMLNALSKLSSLF